MNHTKAPWNVTGFRDGYYKILGAQIELGPEDCEQDLSPEEIEEIDEANARLISQAPYLYEACEYGGIGLDTIILLHNAAGLLEETGTEAGKQCAYALRKKGELEYNAIQKAKGGLK